MALLAVLSLTAPYAPAYAQAGAGTPARVITNTAAARWSSSGRDQERQSNRVDLRVYRLPPPGLVLYRIDSAGGTGQSLAGASCTSAAGQTVPFGFAGVRSTLDINRTSLAETSTIRAGEPLIFGVSKPGANSDPGAADSLSMALSTDGGDTEWVTLVETGATTGFFMGAIDTRAIPPLPVKGDCRLSLRPGEKLVLGAQDDPAANAFAGASVDVLIDPFGIAFDSRNGDHIPEVRITVVDAATGQPAEVFGDDGVSRYPSTVYTGRTVTDEGGQVYEFPPGDYRFPLMRPGDYRLVVEPVEPYAWPSTRTAAEMSYLTRPGGLPYEITAGSYGGVITLDDPAPVRIDIPLDADMTGLVVSKTASQNVAEPGDLVQYRVAVRNPAPERSTGVLTFTDLIPAQMRLRADSLRLDGEKVTGSYADGRLTLLAPRLPGGATMHLTYVLEVLPNARTGDALNRISVADQYGAPSNIADALVRIERRSIADRMTIVGRIVDGGCSADPAAARGVAGVRIMLEDGSYTVTDAEGRYHFEGVPPGTHVVQLDDASLPPGSTVADCAQTSRSAGRAFSRFVDGQGGSLKRADFRIVQGAAGPVESARPASPVRPEPASDAAAAGAEVDWFAGQKAGIGWVFPALDYNPRAPVIRVAIKHLPNQRVRLYAAGREVDPISFEGARKSADGKFAISLWRGVPIGPRETRFKAEVLDANGAVVETLDHVVHFADTPIQAQLVRDRSRLIADGVSRPVIAVRLTDRDGRPIHHGLAGDFELPAPYYPAVEADAQQSRQLAGLGRARPVWRVEGEEGIAYIELEPTTASGTVSLRFKFRDGKTEREQRIEAWLEPGDRPWTIVGLAEGTVGFNRLQNKVEELGEDSDDVLTDGRLALYAKGRILGKWLMTLAYDSDKDVDQARFGGVIDPTEYYTIYADASERRYDAASIRRLYLRLERPQFYALFGDYETGIDEPELARYVRSFNGVKAEYGSDRLSATAFASDTPNRHGRDEIQGNGLSGPYALGSRDILANSERVVIEVRDRERSDRVLETRLMTRHIDYDIDYAAGTLRFREPILSRDAGLNPQFIIADYEVDGVGSRTLNAGGRVSWRTEDQQVQVAATALHDSNERGKTLLAGADVRYRPGPGTEIRAEVAVSENQPSAQAPGGTNETATAWLVEAEHHSSRVGVMAYVRQQESGFGVGQTNASENGSRKMGLDGRVDISETLLLTGSAWHERYLDIDATRIAGRAMLEYHGRSLRARAGLTLAEDRTADGRTNNSTIVQLGASKRLFDNKLELDAQTELPLGGSAESVDFAARHRLAARYALSSDVSLIGAYELADGKTVDSRTARLGLELQPWAGARISATGNVQQISEYGPRSFAAFGLSQGMTAGEHWSFDLSLDGNRTLGGIDPADVVNPAHPVANGGFLGSGGLIEDFTALSAGATYRAELWSVTGRAEYRAGELGDRYGVTLAALRQIGEGRALGAAASYLAANSDAGAHTTTASAQVSWAHRPAMSSLSFLDKLELRHDAVSGAIAGVPGPIGVPLTISGGASSTRLINSLSVNWSPAGPEGVSRTEVSLFWGARYVSDRFGEEDIAGFSNVLGADLRYDINETLDIGGAFTVRQGIGMRHFSYSGGPSVGLSPFTNGWMSLGWNVVGFHDRDFEEQRYTRNGPYVTMRFKFDQLSLLGLGLGR